MTAMPDICNKTLPDADVTIAATRPEADRDATLVAGSPAVHVSDAEDPTRVEFLRKVQARAKAKATPPQYASATDVRPAPVKDNVKRKKAFFSPVITQLMGKGLLFQRDAISASLRAREQGVTFLSALSQINSLANDVAFYAALAQELAEADWLTFKEADQRGCLLLQPTADGHAQYAAIDPFDLIIKDWVSD